MWENRAARVGQMTSLPRQTSCSNGGLADDNDIDGNPFGAGQRSTPTAKRVFAPLHLLWSSLWGLPTQSTLLLWDLGGLGPWGTTGRWRWLDRVLLSGMVMAPSPPEAPAGLTHLSTPL